MRKLGWFVMVLGGGAASIALGAAGCGSGDSSGFDASNDQTNPFATDTGNPFVDGGVSSDGKQCTGLCTKIVNCGSQPPTSVSGTVYDPAGKVPLYNVAVYVPNAPLSPIVHGATCDTCGSTLSGDPVVATLTDAAGHFKLDNVPVDQDVPLVIQIGKWRRRITLPATPQCADTPLPAAQTRLARKPAETSPDDDIPKIAIATGGADALECLLPLIGIDSGEFTNVSGGGRVNLYKGNGGSVINGSTPGAQPFWSDANQLKNYDITMLSCEGSTYPTTKPASALQAMQTYANAGGRVFASHFHYYWLQSSPAPWPTTATWNHASNPPQTQWPVLIDQSFAKGQAFAQWMLNVGGSTTLGTFPIDQARHDVDAVNGQPPSDPVSVRWVYANSPNLVEYYSFNTPVGKPTDQQCGKVVFSDLHVGAGNQPGGTFPSTTCTQSPTLTPQEKALEFLLFDLSSCIQNDTTPPPPPVR
ncbi:MAG TPA: carboxypeptidase regulatory-like domain-containing protein [Polyangiaceae bacterium]|nr:carboxypeptidase regulatory-like domain-containing protein [Polyangiaceae bacterium]